MSYNYANMAEDIGHPRNRFAALSLIASAPLVDALAFYTVGQRAGASLALALAVFLLGWLAGVLAFVWTTSRTECTRCAQGDAFRLGARASSAIKFVAIVLASSSILRGIIVGSLAWIVAFGVGYVIGRVLWTVDPVGSS
jgi:hypothetical protein